MQAQKIEITLSFHTHCFGSVCLVRALNQLVWLRILKTFLNEILRNYLKALQIQHIRRIYNFLLSCRRSALRNSPANQVTGLGPECIKTQKSRRWWKDHVRYWAKYRQLWSQLL